MTDDNQEGTDKMPKAAATKLPDAEGWLAPVLANANAAIQQAGEEIASGVAAEAANAPPEPARGVYPYRGHTDGSHALIAAHTVIIESEVSDINEEIRLVSDEAAYLVRLIEANRDDKLTRLYGKRDNALKAIEAMHAQSRVLGQ